MVVGEFHFIGTLLLLKSIAGFVIAGWALGGLPGKSKKIERGESNEFWTSYSDRKRFIRRS